MSAADHLAAYAEGWTTGDADKIVGSLSDSYVLDDPNEGKITKTDISNFVAKMKEAIAAQRGEEYPGPVMELADAITYEDGGVLTAWLWWSVPGTTFQGAGLIKAGDDGVQSERIAYYTKLPE